MKLYKPRPVPKNPDDWPAYLQREFTEISAAIQQNNDLDELHAEPSRPRDGMIRYADGTNWDPGAGEGVYLYKNDDWFFLADVPTAGYWDDETAEIANSQPRGTAPILQPFGATSITQQYEFNRGDGIQTAFHMRHGVKPGSLVYPHVHWSTDGTGSGDVEWVLEMDLAKGHQQEEFAAMTSITLVQTADASAWHHHIVEASSGQAFTAPEVDSLLLMKISRGSTSDTYDNTGNGNVFCLFVDLHYLKDRIGTKNKAPNFYT